MVTATVQPPVIEAQGLTKVFKDFWGRPKARAVNDVNFTVRRGQVFGLLGPNGSGKSTTVKMLLGLLYPSRGRLEVLGESPRRVEVKRRIGYLPEESYLYRYLTAMETLDFFGSLFGIGAQERTRRCEQLLEMVGLTSSRNRPVGEFSKGMARRIGLAQALINDPELVILDEPTAGLDPIGCKEIKDVIRLLAERGKTVILCSHLLADVEDVCDSVIVLYGGKICAHGGLKEMLQIEDKTRIVAPRLDQTTLDKVLDILRDQLSGERFEVDHPSMNLEEFFLEVVRKAREASIETSGAQAGGRIADYLKDGTREITAEEHRTEVLAALTGAERQESLAVEEPPVSAEVESTSESAGEKLAHLLEHTTAETAESEPDKESTQEKQVKTAKEAAETLHAASQKLKNLLAGEDDHDSNQ